MSKITLNDVGSLIDSTTAKTTINNNSNAIEIAFDNTLSLDGTVPNQMGSELDMNSHQVLNLPAPATANSPLRLQDLSDFTGGGVVTNMPIGGTTGQVLSKNSNTNYDTGWRNSVTSVGLALPTDFTITGSPVTTTGTLTGSWAIAPTGTGAVVRATSPVLVTPALGTPASGVATNLTGTAAGLTAGNVTTNANLTGAVTSVGNAASLGSFTSANLKTALTDETGSGAAVFATSPALVTPTGIVKGDVGLGNVDNTSDATKNAAVATLTNKTIDVSQLTGTIAAARMPALTGDITTSAGAVATTLATVASAGTTGSSTAIPVITINAKGLTTGITTAAVVAPAGTLTGVTLASGVTASSLTSLGTIASLTATTINAFTLGGTVAGGGNQINNVIIGTTTPLAGIFTTLTGNTSVSSPIHTSSGSYTFQSNGSTFAGSISTGQLWYLGATSLTPAAGTTLTVSQNTGGSPGTSSIGNIIQQLIAADTVIGLATLDTFGNQSFLAARHAGGTQAAKTATAGGANTFTFGAQGWDTAAYFTGAALDFISTASTWSASNHGMFVRFRTIVDGATSLTEVIRIGAGLGVGTTSDPGLGMIYTNAATFMIRTKTSYTNGAAASVGTLTNAPAATNPTKWIPIDDNGTTRYIPAW